MDRNQLRNQESRILGFFVFETGFLWTYLVSDLHKESQAQEEMIFKSHSERSIRRKQETYDLRVICPTASRFEKKSL